MSDLSPFRLPDFKAIQAELATARRVVAHMLSEADRAILHRYIAELEGELMLGKTNAFSSPLRRNGAAPHRPIP